MFLAKGQSFLMQMPQFFIPDNATDLLFNLWCSNMKPIHKYKIQLSSKYLIGGGIRVVSVKDAVIQSTADVDDDKG